MSMTKPKPGATGHMKAGQRLHCESCGSEIEIIAPCTCDPPDWILQCCGKPMTPSVGQNVHLNVE